ncbi:hypothetical protein PIIN_10458 [Serendipita indica DSM 11827]|uniref:Uncharacterized protein n=1 Tax=Serendipita indica (strain DSM 11827) TaxID=1109443 RepID=G4TYS2_SERID|nr:hypothetical protein PIIN_10458 [Serendipita indica DSM 11827]
MLAKQQRDEMSLLEARVRKEREQMDFARNSIQALEASERSMVQLCDFLDNGLANVKNMQSSLVDLTSSVDVTGLQNAPIDIQSRQIFDQVAIAQQAQMTQTFILIDEHRIKVSQNLRVLRETLALQRLQVHGSKGSLNALEKQRQIVEDFIHEIYKQQSPQRRIPSEIWQRIFRSTVNGIYYDVFHDQSHRSFPFMALTLAHVCQLWRDIVFAQPELWTCTPYASRSNSFYEFIFKRCSGLPVTLLRLRITELARTEPTGLPLVLRHLFFIKKSSSKHSESSQTIYLDSNRAGQLTLRQTLQLRAPELHIRNVNIRFEENSSADHIKKLTFDTTGELSFDISPFLYPHLEELRILSRYIDIKKPELTEIKMHQLAKLTITTSHVRLAEVIDAPKLDSLTVLGRGMDAIPIIPQYEQIKALSDLLAPCTELILEGWTEPIGSRGSSANEVRYFSDKLCLSLLQSHPGIKRVVFRRTHVDATRLVRAICSESGLPAPKLEGITFDRCTGVTQADCDGLSRVLKVHVYL